MRWACTLTSVYRSKWRRERQRDCAGQSYRESLVTSMTCDKVTVYQWRENVIISSVTSSSLTKGQALLSREYWPQCFTSELPSAVPHCFMTPGCSGDCDLFTSYVLTCMDHALWRISWTEPELRCHRGSTPTCSSEKVSRSDWGCWGWGELINMNTYMDRYTSSVRTTATTTIFSRYISHELMSSPSPLSVIWTIMACLLSTLTDKLYIHPQEKDGSTFCHFKLSVLLQNHNQEQTDVSADSS